MWGSGVLGAFFGFFSVSCAYGESLFCWSPCYVQDLGHLGVPPAGHALLVEFGGGHYLCNPWGEHLKIHKVANMSFGVFLRFFIWEPYMLALVGQPSLHGYYACMVY